MGQYSAEDVAEFIIVESKNDNNPVDNLRLQKMLFFLWVEYYKEKKMYLFDDDIEAWKYGPVVPVVYWKYRQFVSNPIILDCGLKLKDDDAAFLKSKIKKLNRESTSSLIQRSHDFKAWKDAFNKGYRSKMSYNSIKESVD